jgi:hypothetical protein
MALSISHTHPQRADPSKAKEKKRAKHLTITSARRNERKYINK